MNICKSSSEAAAPKSPVRFTPMVGKLYCMGMKHPKYSFKKDAIYLGSRCNNISFLVNVGSGYSRDEALKDYDYWWHEITSEWCLTEVGIK